MVFLFFLLFSSLFSDVILFSHLSFHFASSFSFPFSPNFFALLFARSPFSRSVVGDGELFIKLAQDARAYGLCF